MSATVRSKDPLKELEEHLASQVKLAERRGDFDMDDGPEADVLIPFPALKTALGWLNTNLGERWHKADREALSCQRRHRQLARIAIAAGTSAIVLAVVQLSIKLTLPKVTWVAGGLELIAIVAAAIAIGFGLWAKFDRRWLAQRHLAERLRMLKFRALEQLCCFDPDPWRHKIKGEIISLENLEDPKAIREKIETWSNKELIEPDLVVAVPCDPDPGLLRALTTYYFFKRVEFQADYFDRRRKDFKRETGHWLHLSLPLFLISVVFVFAHFALDYFAPHHVEPQSNLLEVLAVSCVALAAILPIIGLGMRAWFAAFELPRSASLFGAKHRALKEMTNQLEQDAGKVLPSLNHLAQAEHFLEHEHREWLRLLADTEWFL